MRKDLDASHTELAAVKKERDVAKAHTGVSPTAVAQAIGAKESAERNLEQSKQRMSELVARFRETATNLKDVKADRGTLRREFAERNSAFDQCAEDKLQL